MTTHKARLGNQNGRKYDPEDYIEEFQLLTSLGMRGADIIRRSNPCLSWWDEYVKPSITWAVCMECNSPFRVQAARSLVKCHHMCGAELGGGRHRRLRSV